MKGIVRNLVLILVAQVTMPGATDVAVGGTMVVAVRFREGLVVCADKRSHLDGPDLPKGNYRDDDVKITLVNQIGGFVTAGVPILERADGVRVFDADRVIGDHLGEMGFGEFDQLAQRAEDAFRSYILSKHPAERPPTQWHEGQPVFFRALIFFAVQRVSICMTSSCNIRTLIGPRFVRPFITDRRTDSGPTELLF